MTIDALRQYCLSKPGASEGLPFGDDALVFKVQGKMFALLGLSAVPPSINLKCDPEWSADLRERYASVTPGYHMSKKHWNTVVADGEVPAPEVREMIDHSYDLVVRGLPKAQREALGQL